MADTLRALTLTQPWATLVALKQKTIETRGWQTSYRGEIAIHAAKGFPQDARGICPMEPFRDALGAEVLHTGKIVAVATLSECFRFDERTARLVAARSLKGLLPRWEVDFGDYSMGRYGFVLTNIRRVPEPVAARGMLNFWAVPDEAAALVRKQLAMEVAHV